MSPSLDPDGATLERWLREACAFVLDHLESLEAAPATGVLGAEGLAIARRVSRPIADEPLRGGMTEALRRLAEAVPASLTTAGPGYMAYIPGGGLPASAIAALLGDAVNRFTGIAAAAPALVRLEADVLDWLAGELGWGEESRGILTSGGSMANLGAVVAARLDRLGEGGDLRSATVHASAQVHHSVAKSLRVAGIPAGNLRLVPCDERQRLDVRALAESLRADADRGDAPFLVIASAGTTNTGAIDPLPELADLCRDGGPWLHVDAAYGGAFYLCDVGRRRLAGMERADSVALDPHKGLFVPYGVGCLLVRRGEQLARAHATAGEYLRDFDVLDRNDEPPSPSDLGPELSRPYRGLLLWLPLVLHGARAFREALSEKLELAERLYEGLRRRVDAGAPLETLGKPQLSIAAFRLRRREREPLAGWNARNTRLNAAINARQRVALSTTTLPVADGMACTLRACILSFRTHADRVDALLEDLDDALAELESDPP